MQKALDVIPTEQDFVISNLPPGSAQKRLASAVVIGIIVIAILVMGPLSGFKVGQAAAFLPMYLMAMFLCDSNTAILLFAQFAISRSLASLVIATGYVFTAITVIPYSLTFPGVFAPNSLIGGLQSTAWLYDLWHAGFPLFVIGYALLKGTDPSKRLWRGRVSSAIVTSVAGAAGIVSVAVVLCIVGENYSPVIILDSRRFGPLFPYYVALPVVTACICALILLWNRRHSLLDLWLMVVLCLFVVEMPISYYPDPERFSLGWYTARVIGFMNSSILLIVLLYEITTLYARLLRAVHAQRRERDARLITGDAVAATISHEVRQPLAAMITRAETSFRLLDRPIPDLDKTKAALKQIAADGHRAGAVIESIRANFKKDDRARAPLNVNRLIGEVLGLMRDELRNHQIILKIERDAELPQVIADQIQLQQVLLNLITNAIDSMAAKNGTRLLHVRSEARGDGAVVVSVADTGAGINSQDLQRVFNPLFTTKPDGMGMGLSICRSIIEAHDGELSVVPNSPQGAVFQFALRTPS